MKIPMRILRQSKGLSLHTTRFNNVDKVMQNRVEVVGTTAQLQRWWEHQLRCTKRFGWLAPLERMHTITMYNVEHEGVLECQDVRDLLAHIER